MKGKQIIASCIAVLAIIALIYFIVTNRGGNKYQWWESYRADSNQPYGTMFIKKMLEEFPKQGIAVVNVGADPRLSDWKNTTYFCADKIHPNNAGYGVIAEVVAKSLLNPTRSQPIGVPVK